MGQEDAAAEEELLVRETSDQKADAYSLYHNDQYPHVGEDKARGVGIQSQAVLGKEDKLRYEWMSGKNT